jgi:hypothetical protein
MWQSQYVAEPTKSLQMSKHNVQHSNSGNSGTLDDYLRKSFEVLSYLVPSSERQTRIRDFFVIIFSFFSSTFTFSFLPLSLAPDLDVYENGEFCLSTKIPCQTRSDFILLGIDALFTRLALATSTY